MTCSFVNYIGENNNEHSNNGKLIEISLDIYKRKKKHGVLIDYFGGFLKESKGVKNARFIREKKICTQMDIIRANTRLIIISKLIPMSKVIYLHLLGLAPRSKHIYKYLLLCIYHVRIFF